LVARLQALLKREGVKSTRITGKENDKKRANNQDQFQDLESDTNVVFITDAGSEAINLQAAVAEIFYDSPWSWGDYVQILGRMIRIGSPHQSVLAYHLVAERPSASKKSRKTIDHHVLSLLRRKKGLIDKVLGEAAVGALKFDKPGSSTIQLIKAMREDA
jgi:SNF2 family DNA or RNA helicase